MSIRANYTEIPGIATEMSNEGGEISKLLADSFEQVSGLNPSWTGIRYNTVAAEFNAIIPNINELEDLMITEIPTALGQVAKNYASVDGGSAPAVSEAAKIATVEIPNADTEVLNFDAGLAEEVLGQVKGNFSSIQSSLDSYKSQYNSLDWESPASESFKARFEKLSSDLAQSFENLCTTFDRAMTQAKEDMLAADDANNIG